MTRRSPCVRSAMARSRRPSLLCAVPALALDYPPLTPDPAAFKARRERFLAQLPPKSIAILRSAPMRTMTNDVEYPYRQDSDFYYLTGIDADDVTAVLRPDAPDGKKYVLFVRPRDLRREAWAGVRVGPDEAPAAYGADAAFALEDFDEKLRHVRSGRLQGERLPHRRREAVSLRRPRRGLGREVPDVLQDAARAGQRPVDDRRRARHRSTRCASSRTRRSSKFLRRAAQMSAQGHVRAMEAAAPGKWEFEVQQALDGYCYANGARRMAYPSIARLGSELLHPPLRAEPPADEGRRGPPERLRDRVRLLRHRHHAHVSRQRPLLARAAGDLRHRARRAERRRWRSSSRARRTRTSRRRRPQVQTEGS